MEELITIFLWILSGLIFASDYYKNSKKITDGNISQNVMYFLCIVGWPILSLAKLPRYVQDFKQNYNVIFKRH